MVMGLFGLMAESGPGDCHIVEEKIDEIEVERDENCPIRLQGKNKRAKQKKQHKQIRNYTNHDPVHLGRNEEQSEQPYHLLLQHQDWLKGTVVQWTLDSLPSAPATYQSTATSQSTAISQSTEYGMIRNMGKVCFYDQVEEDVEQQVQVDLDSANVSTSVLL